MSDCYGWEEIDKKQIKEHIIEHIKNDDYALAIEMTWQLYKREHEEIKKLVLK